MTIKANMDFNNQYSHDVISSFNSSPPPSTNLQRNNSGSINSRMNHHNMINNNNNNSQQMMTNTNNEMITYHNNNQIMGESKISQQSISRSRDDDDYLSIEDIDELDKDLTEIMNDLLIPTEMKQELSQYSEYGACGSSNNSQTQTFNGTMTNISNNNTNNNNNNNTKKMRKKKRKKSKHKLEKEGVSYDPPKHLRAQGNVQISKNLTENIIPSRIAEPIEDIYRYMDKLTALHCIYNDMTLEINNNDNNNENIMILNYGFHDKDTHKILYCIAEKQDISNNKSRGYKWRIINRLFTCDEIENEYNVSSDLLPKTFNQSFHFKSLLNYQSNIEKLLYSDSIRSNMISNCPWHKIEIYHRTNNKRRLTLSLTKPEFMKSMQNCTRSKLTQSTVNNNHNSGNIKLIPILLFDNDQCQYLIEFVWILEIEPEIDIGISFKYIANTDSLKVTGIHLDPHFIKNQHQLIDPQHDCHCLDSFNTTINMMAIGNPDDNINKIKYYKQQIDELQLYKEHLIELLTTDSNRRDHVIQSLIQKTGIGAKSSINTNINMNMNVNKQQQRMMNQNQNQYQHQQQYNNNPNCRNMNHPQRQSPQPINMNTNMNNMNRFPVNHCQVQARPQPHPQPMMSRMQQQAIAGNPNGIINRNTMPNNVNYNNMNMYSSNNVNSANVSNHNHIVNNNRNNNSNNNNNQNLFNPIYNGMGSNNWHSSNAQMSMYPKQ